MKRGLGLFVGGCEEGLKEDWVCGWGRKLFVCLSIGGRRVFYSLLRNRCYQKEVKFAAR